MQVGQIGRAGDVAADGAVEVVDIERNAVGCDGRAEDGNISRGGDGSGQGWSGVRHDEVDALGDKAVDDSAAVDGIARGILHIDGHGVAERFFQCVDEALRCGIERLMLHELADTDGVGLSAFCRSRITGITRFGSRSGIGCGLCRGASSESQDHHKRQKHCKHLFHNKLLLFFDNSWF